MNVLRKFVNLIMGGDVIDLQRACSLLGEDEYAVRTFHRNGLLPAVCEDPLLFDRSDVESFKVRREERHAHMLRLYEDSEELDRLEEEYGAGNRTVS